MKTILWKVLALSALGLAGCDAGPALQDDATAAAPINPYPAGEASPMFFRSSSQWEPYAAVKSADVQAGQL